MCSAPGALVEACDACPMCGLPLLDSVERRYQPFASVVSLVRQHCTPTPFVHGALLRRAPCAGAPRIPFCIPCINWIRRLRRHARRGNGPAPRSGSNGRKDRLIPVDELLAFLVHPGQRGAPDLRSLPRLLQTLLQAPDGGGRFVNQYLQLAPAYTRRLAPLFEGVPSPCGESVMASIVTEWWAANGRPQAFTNKVRAAPRPAPSAAAPYPARFPRTGDRQDRAALRGSGRPRGGLQLGPPGVAARCAQ